MHTKKITPNLLFEYQCTSGKFIRLPNRIETFCPNWNVLLYVAESGVSVESQYQAAQPSVTEHKAVSAVGVCDDQRHICMTAVISSHKYRRSVIDVLCNPLRE